MSERTSDEAGDPIRLAALEAFVEVSADALISQDADGRIVAWNRSAERIFGRHAEDVVGTPMRDLFPEHVRDDVVVLLDTVAGGARVDHVETEVARRDGMRIPISVSLRPVCDADGSCCGVVGVARDLTEQRLTQSALAETEARLRDAEALAHAGRWLWDVDSGAVQWSEEMHRINGVDPATFEGTLDAHLARVHPDDVDALRDAFDDRRVDAATVRHRVPDPAPRRCRSVALLAAPSRRSGPPARSSGYVGSPRTSPTVATPAARR